MAQNQNEQDRPIAGDLVAGTTDLTNKAADQVQSAVVEAVDGASELVLPRVVGVAKASHTILDALLREGIDIQQSARQNIVTDFLGDAVSSLEQLQADIDKALEQLKGAAGENK